MSTTDKPDWLISSDLHAQQSPRPKTSEFVADVYRMYGRNFWDFYKLSVPPTLLALVVYTARPVLSSMITSGAPRGREILMHPGVVVGVGLANLSSFFLAWFLEAFTFAAATDVVGGLYRGTDVETDGYARARERIWEVLKISLATFIPFILGLGFLMFLFTLAILRLNSRLLDNYWFALGLVNFQMLLLFAALVGFAFAIPMVMATDATAGKALRASWRLTDGQEGKLILFVAESLVGTVVAMYAMSWLSYVIFSRVNGGGWGVWAVAIAAALLGATVQAPMLIAFALLYFKIAEPRAT
jgi:hypothetical protein